MPFDPKDLTAEDIARLIDRWQWSVQETEYAPPGVWIIANADRTKRVVTYNAETLRLVYERYREHCLTATEGYWPVNVGPQEVILRWGQRKYAIEQLKKQAQK